MPSYRFDTPAPIRLNLSDGSGVVTITATDTTETLVEVTAGDDRGGSAKAAENTTVDLSHDGGEVEIRVPHRHVRASVDIAVTLPAGSSLHCTTGSADVRATGPLGTTRMGTGSGNLTAEDVSGDVEMTTGSGNVTVGSVSGRTTAKSGSGNLAVQTAAGPVHASTASGEVHVGTSAASLRVKGASGNITVERISGGPVDISTASGNISLGLASGVVAKLDVSSISGQVESQLPVDDVAPGAADGPVVDIRAHTVSGNALVRSAVPDRA